MNVTIDTTNYRNTGAYLNENKSTRGTSKNEVLHSTMDRVFYVSNNIRELLFDARGHWAVTNFNRQRLKKMGKPALIPGVAPMEDDSCPLLPETTTLRFGFDYCKHVMKQLDDEINDEVLAALATEGFVVTDILDEPNEEYVDADDTTDVATVSTFTLAGRYSSSNQC